MPDISPEEMAKMQEQAGSAPNGGEATALAQQVGEGLSKLADMLDASPGATDEDRAKMAQVMQGFVELVEKNLAGSAPGQNPEEEGPSAPIPAMGGAKGVPMGPQGAV
jgi:hypothetical protein